MAELFLEDSQSLAVVMDDGRVEKVLSGLDRGAGLRLIRDRRTVYAHGNELGPEALLPLAANLAAQAPGPAGALLPPAALRPGLAPLVVKPPRDAATARKVAMVRAAEAAARAVDPRIRQVRVSYQEKVQRIRVANSLGVDVEDLRTYVVLAVHCVAEDHGVAQTATRRPADSAGWNSSTGRIRPRWDGPRPGGRS